LLSLSLEDFDGFVSFPMQPIEDNSEPDINNNEDPEDMDSAEQLLDGLIGLMSNDEQGRLESVWRDLNVQSATEPALEDIALVQPPIVEEATVANNLPTVEPTNSDPTLVLSVVQQSMESIWGNLNEQSVVEATVENNLPTLEPLDSARDEQVLLEFNAVVQSAYVEATATNTLSAVEPTNSDPTLVPTVVQQPTLAVEASMFEDLIDTVTINGRVVHVLAVDIRRIEGRRTRGRPRVERERTTPYPSDWSERKKEQDKTASRKYRDNKRAEEANALIEVSVLESKNRELKAEVAGLESELAEFKTNVLLPVEDNSEKLLRIAESF